MGDDVRLLPTAPTDHWLRFVAAIPISLDKLWNQVPRSCAVEGTKRNQIEGCDKQTIVAQDPDCYVQCIDWSVLVIGTLILLQ